MNIEMFTSLDNVKVVRTGSRSDVMGICYDNRKVISGSMFIAVKGFSSDGHKYIADAIKKGAQFIVLEDAQYLNAVSEDCFVLQVKDSRAALAEFSSVYFDRPSKDMKLIGVTGTNGKTSISTYIYNYFKKYKNIETGLIGTISYLVGDRVIDAPNTTPESYEYQKLLHEMRAVGSEYVVSEVSSHALSLNRVDSTEFSIAAYTNLTRDHLDFHKDMEDYYEAKSRLFKKYLKDGGVSVINIDDEHGQKLYKELTTKKISCSLVDRSADVFGEIAEMTMRGTTIIISYFGKEYSVFTPLIGEFNMENLLIVIGVLVGNGEVIDDVMKYAEIIEPVIGRFQNVDLSNGAHAIVDYAHTSDALVNVLQTVNKIRTGRTITVFGAGGDRDKGKRVLMAQAASEYSDISIVTSDNPRTENPDEIVRDVLKGMSGVFEAIVDRSLAIKRAIELSKKDDVIVIAGKGHENYQIIGADKFHFSDFEEIIRWDVK